MNLSQEQRLALQSTYTCLRSVSTHLESIIPNLQSWDELHAKNLLNFLDILVDKKAKALAVNWDDEIVKATALTKDGAVVHPNFQPKSAA